MRVDFYTLELRNLGQDTKYRAQIGVPENVYIFGVHRRERTVIQIPPQRLAIKTLVVLIERVCSGVPENRRFLGKRRWRHKT